MKRCPNCHQDNLDSAAYCSNCGAEIRSPHGDTLQLGQTMNNGQYRIVQRLGAGGMGAIYLAQNTQAFDRKCVVKEMIAYYQPGEEKRAQERFEQEARTLAALKHPGVPDMYGYFSERGHNYIVMEYIEGDNLEKSVTHESRSGERVAARPLDAKDVVHYGVEICRVLEYLAQVQPEPVVHCDIKPANIIIDSNSKQAVLVDFGTAKARYAHAVQGQPDPKRDSVYGTVGYAAPEMYQGKAVPKSDVFSLAATLYHLLTDDDPAENPFKWTAMQRVAEPLRSILQHALTPEIDARLDATQFRQELESYRAAQSDSIHPLTFPEGNLATTLTGFLDLALRYWEYARQVMLDGSLDAWLRQTAHDPVAANRARELAREYASVPDAALDTFVREYNPRIPQAQLLLDPAAFDFQMGRKGEALEAKAVLSNAGPGASYGSVRGSVPWLLVEPQAYALPPGRQIEMQVSIDPKKLSAGQSSGQIIIAPQTGQALLAEATVSTPATRKAGQRAVAKPSKIPPAQATPAHGRRFPLVVAYVLLALAIGGGTTLGIMTWSKEGDVDQGIAALQAGDWAKGIPQIENLNPQDTARVHQVARLLDDMTVSVPAGTFQMGSDSGAPDQQPAHEVAVADVIMDRFEATNAQYQRFVDETGHSAPDGWTGGYFPSGRAMHPVTGITWEDARAYAAWVGKRLPSEAEWEFAARGSEGRAYPWGDEPDAQRANVKDGLKPGEQGQTAPVGSYPQGATPLGIQDMAGNAREWTEDRYGDYQVPHNPPSEGNRIVVRGASWNTYHDTAAARGWEDRNSATADLGFRCVR
jgi:formylglycine-generating enzyme required for sulfatase activity/serine/threonine protein kinase